MESFEAVAGAYRDQIFRYLRRIAARPAEAEDLAQETFLRAYRAFRALPPDANVRAWLFAIATNLARNQLRQEQRRRAAHRAVEQREARRSADSPEDEAGAQEARRLLERAIATLPMKQRTAFVLRKLHGLPYEEVARSLACSPESARANVFQALRKLRIHLNGYALPDREVE